MGKLESSFGHHLHQITEAADVSVQARVENVTDAPQKGVLKGSFGDVTFEQSVEVAAHSSQTVRVDPKSTPAMHLEHPKLWWPNGYGPQNLYKLHLSFEVDGKASDDREVSFGVRKFTYAVPGSENLTISVNGVRVLAAVAPVRRYPALLQVWRQLQSASGSEGQINHSRKQGFYQTALALPIVSLPPLP
jgi:hypothetical protein